MPKPDSSNTDTVIDDVNKNTDKNLNDIDNNNDNVGADKQTVPLSTFLKTKDEIKNLKDKLQKIEDDKRKADEDKLKEKGDLQKLLDQKEEEIKILKPKAEERDKLRTEEIEQIKKLLRDKWDDDFEKLSLPALRKMAVTLTSKKDDPNLDKGSQGAGSNGKQLTATQKKEAYEKFPTWTKEKAEEAWLDVLISTGKIK